MDRKTTIISDAQREQHTIRLAMDELACTYWRDAQPMIDHLIELGAYDNVSEVAIPKQTYRDRETQLRQQWSILNNEHRKLVQPIIDELVEIGNSKPPHPMFLVRGTFYAPET